MSRKVKSVSFNLSDPMEIQMYEHSMKYPSFSTFVKRLIQNAMNTEAPITIKNVDTASANVISTPTISKEIMKQLI